MKINLKFMSLVFSFLLFFGKTAFSQSSNCSYADASIYFNAPSAVLSSYSPSYYCSDILYLIKTGKGNITLSSYKSLYPQNINSNIDYLRSVGITPDIVSNYFDETNIDGLSSKSLTENYMKVAISEIRTNNDLYIKTSPIYEPDENMFDDKSVGAILNKERNFKSCYNPTEKTYSATNSLYSSDEINYSKIISALPVALKPVVLNGNKFLNLFGEEVAILKNNIALGSKTREVIFSNNLFDKSTYVTISWDDGICRAQTLQEIVDRNSVCYLCPYIIMIFNEISYLFEYMYINFRDIIIAFLVVFGCIFFASQFAKSFTSLPFSFDASSYPKEIAKKLKLILIVCTLILVPPRFLFSWTVEPVIGLTLAVSDTIMQVGNTEDTKFTCDGNTVIEKMNDQRKKEQDELITPPVVKKREIESSLRLEEEVIISKQTMGNIVCFLVNTLEMNAKQMMMGEILMRDIFTPGIKEHNSFLNFVFGVCIFFLYFFISFMISFYVLDGLLEFFKFAFTWPFYIFGYAFPFIKFNIKDIMGVAKKFGLTMVNLAVFSLFNMALVQSFYFTNRTDNVLEILNEAIQTDDKSIILENLPADLLSMTQFLFIIYCVYYLYTKLGQIAQSYGGEQNENIPIGKGVKSLVESSMKLFVKREDKGYLKKDEKKNDNKDIKEEKTDE